MTGPHDAAMGLLPRPGAGAAVKSCASSAQVERLVTLAALRRLGLASCELDDLLAILEELDDGWATSSERGALLVAPELVCTRLDRLCHASGKELPAAHAALRRRLEEPSATARGGSR